MTISELQELVSRTELQGLSRCILVVNRKSNPKGWKIRVNGMGLGEIASVQEKNGQIQVVAWFFLNDVKKYIRKYYLINPLPSQRRSE